MENADVVPVDYPISLLQQIGAHMFGAPLEEVALKGE